VNALQCPGVLAADELIDKAPIHRQVVKVRTPAQQQRIPDSLFQVSVWALDRAILVRDAAIVAGRLHAIVSAQSFVTRSEVFACVVVEIAEGGRETVAAMLAGSPTERPERVLQSFGERDIALATEDDMGMLKA